MIRSLNKNLVGLKNIRFDKYFKVNYAPIQQPNVKT